MYVSELSLKELYIMDAKDEDYFFEDAILEYSSRREVLREFTENYKRSIWRLYKIKEENFDKETEMFFEWFNVTGKDYFNKILDSLIDEPVVSKDNFLKILIRYSHLLEDACLDHDVDQLLNWLYEIPSSLLSKMTSYRYVKEDQRIGEIFISAEDFPSIDINRDIFEVDNGLQFAGLSYV